MSLNIHSRRDFFRTVVSGEGPHSGRRFNDGESRCLERFLPEREPNVKALQRHAKRSNEMHNRRTEMQHEVLVEEPLPPTPIEMEPKDDFDDVPTYVQVLQDPANVCTFAGAIRAALATACLWKGRQIVAM